MTDPDLSSREGPGPQGLKPTSFTDHIGTAKAVPFPNLFMNYPNLFVNEDPKVCGNSQFFEGVVRELLAKGLSVRFQARGASMSPAIRDGEYVEVTPVIVAKLRKDDIVLAKSNYGFRLHRIVLADHERDLFITRGDCGQENDPAFEGAQILGLARAKEVRIGRKTVQARFKGVMGRTLRCAARAQYVAEKLLKRGGRSRSAAKAGISLGLLFLLLLAAASMNAQVAFDRTANLATNQYCTGAGTCSFTWVHRVGNAATNYVLVVTASLNIKNSPTSSVSSITYNGNALTFQGAHNDAQSIMRTEIWTLLAPPTGANHNVVMVVNNPAAVTIGVMAGSASFSGVDQTVPVGGYVSNDGGNNANTGYSMLDVPSVVNGMVVDALAAGGQTITIPAPENTIYTQQSNNQTSATNVYGAAAYEAGVPSVPMAETFTINAGQIPNWSESAISLNPSQADIGVSTTVAPVAPGTDSVYNMTVYNNGPSAAATVKLVDTLGTGTTYVSYTASAGVTCTDAGATLTCTVGALAPNATATVALTVSTTAAGFYPNTAVVSDSGTPPDFNQGNNTYVAVAPVQTVICATSVLTVGGSLTGTINTYYPGSATVAEGATSIPVGTATGAGATIASGTELLVVQMQNASINDSNNIAYGNGFTGQGFTAVNTSGNYEFVTATGPIAGGAIPIHGAGPGGGLIFTYTKAALSATAGASTYQVVVVPQYSSATLTSGLTAQAWNGSTGGILAMDVAGLLTLGNADVDMDGMGFRGAAGLSLVGENGAADTDYEFTAPGTYTVPAINTIANTTGADGSKGEGVAGTPLWIQAGATPTNTGSGYPSGTAAKDGSMGRGAPANAGGGATDGAPTPAGENNDNAGGGGGGNGGAGGFGGNSYGNNLSVGGEGGVAFPVTVNRFAMGGGGGAGSNNYYQNSQDSSGGAGGGIIFIRADTLSGTATLTANGIGAYTGTSSNAGGGGGAGGTIVVVTANGGETGLTLQANGGSGGGNQGCTACGTQTFLEGRIGPGGGGGGGAVYTSSVSGLPTIALTGGANGVTQDTSTTPVPYGATAGAAGVSVTNVTLAQLTGLQSTALCTPDMTLQKSHAPGTLTRGQTGTYTIPVENVSPYGATSGVVTVNDTLPAGITPTGASGTGWSCSVSAQTVSCTRSDVLPAASSYQSISVTATVSQSAPSTLTNVATIGGGGEANLLNDTATDVASVNSVSDLAVTESASPNPVAAGSNITYTQVVTNNGPSAADNATLVTAVPTNTTFVSMTAPAGWSCLAPGSGATGNVVCTDVNMPGGATSTATFTMVVKVNTAAANGTVISNTVSVSSSVSDPNSANNTATATTVVGATTKGELTVSNIAAPNPVQAGNDITYTAVVTNTGSAAATGATFAGAITPAADVTFVSITPPAGWTCTGFPATPCSDASVAAGASGTFTVVYQVVAGTASGTTISDTATVNATNQAFGANSAIATDIVGAATQADLALSTAATPSPVFPGNNITYTQAITNNGPGAATGVVFTEAVPANSTFESVSAPAGWTCTSPAVGATTGNVVCNGPASFPASDVADIIVVVGVPSTTTAASITATSSMTATTGDPNSANNSTTVTTPIVVTCDLAVTNTGTPSPVTAGGTITYTQTVTNTGPSSCSTATFTEATPTNTTFQSITAASGWTCTGFPTQCTDASVPAGYSGTFTVVYNVSATATGTITDTATVATTSRDTNLANNSATSTIGVASATQSDLSVTNAGNPNPVAAGSNITYTQSVTNNGPAAAATVSFSDPVPSNTTLVSLTGPAGWTCTTTPAPPTCTIASLAANTTANFSLVVTVNSGTASGTTITQTDSVAETPTTNDPNPSNNSVTATVAVADSAGLSISNSSSPVPVIAGNNITYSQTITNAGPSPASSVTLTETLPADTTGVSLTGPAGWTCTLATLTCTDTSMAVGSASFTYVVKVTAGTASGTAINETATVTSSTTDPNLANNSATAADVVATATQADLVVANSATPTSVAAGSNVTYTQSITNDGPAAATGATFTETTPPNTTFQSLTPPAGWTCTTPAVGATGTITCTDGSTFNTGAANAASLSLVLQVVSGTPSGTSITETGTANATNAVTSSTQSGSATVLVANANSADMAITKTGTPNPVTEGTPLTYTLTVTNNGPASATTVTVSDTLPSSLTYLSSTVTPSAQGTCSEAGGTVTCQLGTMANAATATISILTIPEQAGVISNTATVTADQTDPNPANNSSTWTETVTAPTRITLQSFSAYLGTDKNGNSRAVLIWKTGGEAHNLGFNLYRDNVYRDEDGGRVRLNSSVIAGSALLMKGALAKHSGRSYAWIDSSPGAGGASYWLEDLDVNGVHTMHGPISVQSALANADGVTSATETRMLSQLNQAPVADDTREQSHVVETIPMLAVPTQAQTQKQFELAAHPAVKIPVQHEGWYRLTQPQLVKAGLDPNVDPSLLHLYAEATEQPIEITGATAGPGGFGPQAAINFYGTAIDTVYSGTRMYWLVAEQTPGARIALAPASAGSNQPPLNYPATVELEQHTIYFSALLTKNGNNFFGAIVSSSPVEQLLDVPHLDTKSSQPAQLQVTLQGVIVAFPHDVQVQVNGTTVGDLEFTGQAQGQFNVSLPPGSLQEGQNTITLTGQNGDYDTSLVQSIRITYPHKYAADSNGLKFTGRPGDELTLHGFVTPPLVVDITDPNNPVQLTPQVTAVSGQYQIALQVPWTTTNPAAPARHTLLAAGANRILSSNAEPNHPSHWHAAQAGADIAMVTHAPFANSLTRLVHAHEAEGKSSAVVPVTDLYDEFNFGEKTPMAIRQFLQTAKQNWKTSPTTLLLNGRASLDPRDYLGMGDLDLVPTQILAAGNLMTASDDWFSDFTDSGLPTIATGRLPVATIDDAKTVIGKIVAYEGNSTNGAWTANALMVADRNDTENFTQDAQSVQAQLTKSIQATDVFTALVGTDAARQQIVADINSGQLLVNYTGHGSEEQWSGSDIFDTNTVATLTNGTQLPVFLIMDCLNGFFQDVYAQPLGVVLLLAPNGGAVATLASTGLNQPAPQTLLDKLIVQNALGNARPTLGESILKAKSKIGDVNVRKTFVLFGDPAMRFKQPAAAQASH